MKIEIDFNPTPSNSFFISIPISQTEDICFDNTTKRVGIIKQIIIKKKQFLTIQKLMGNGKQLF